MIDPFVSWHSNQQGTVVFLQEAAIQRNMWPISLFLCTCHFFSLCHGFVFTLDGNVFSSPCSIRSLGHLLVCLLNFSLVRSTNILVKYTGQIYWFSCLEPSNWGIIHFRTGSFYSSSLFYELWGTCSFVVERNEEIHIGLNTTIYEHFVKTTD